MWVCDRCRDTSKTRTIVREYNLVDLIDRFQSPLWHAELCESCKELLVVTILGFMSISVATPGERPESAPGT